MMKLNASKVLALLLVVGCSNTDTVNHGGDSGNDGGEPDGSQVGISNEEAVRSAALLSSCIDENGFAEYVDAFLGADDSLAYLERWGACLASKANGCAGMTECTGVAVMAKDSCESSCNGDVVTFCESGVQLSFDCTSIDPEGPPRACIQIEDGEDCEYVGPTACSGATFVSRCEGNSVVECLDEVEVKRACPAGLQCGYDSDVEAVCQGTGKQCTTNTWRPTDPLDMDLALGCNNDDELEFCANGKTHFVKCSEYLPGYSCRTVAGSSFCGTASECIPSGPARTDASCSGTSLEFCAAGKRVRVDCTALGFSDCRDRSGNAVSGPIPGEK